jgi:glycine/D-amino acid oxidase-like deaminating enzyme
MDSGRSMGYTHLGVGLSLLAGMLLTATLLAGTPTPDVSQSIGVATMQQGRYHRVAAAGR